MRNTILLLIGAIISLLFLIFPAQMFETIFYDLEFSNEMYNQNLYIIVALITTIIAWGGMAIYYYAINSVSFSRWYHWLITVAVCMVLSATVNYMVVDHFFAIEQMSFDRQLFNFCIYDAFTTAILCIVSAFSIRWWSSNCRHTPIPE